MEIWSCQNAEDELFLFTIIRTDGIIDAIRYIALMDGKTMLVGYIIHTKIFQMPYNVSWTIAGTNRNMRYALIDLETGTIYRNGSLY